MTLLKKYESEVTIGKHMPQIVNQNNSRTQYNSTPMRHEHQTSIGNSSLGRRKFSPNNRGHSRDNSQQRKKRADSQLGVT